MKNLAVVCEVKKVVKYYLVDLEDTVTEINVWDMDEENRDQHYEKVIESFNLKNRRYVGKVEESIISRVDKRTYLHREIIEDPEVFRTYSGDYRTAFAIEDIEELGEVKGLITRWKRKGNGRIKNE